MATEVRVPTTGNAGEDAVLVEWKVRVGDVVAPEAVIAVLETAKTTLDVMAPSGGVVLSLHGSPGDELAEFAVIARLGEPGETPDTAPDTTASPDPAPVATTIASVAQPAERKPSTEGRLRVSPRARIIAERRGIDLAQITGSGPHGRILIHDVIRIAHEPVAPAASTTAVKIPVRGARKITAQRMAATVNDVAPVTLQRMAPADVLVEFSTRLKGATEPRIGINELVMFAVALTLPKHPQANAHFGWDEIHQFSHVNLGFAVDNGRALLVPVLRDAHALNLRSFAAESRRLTDLAVDDRLTPDHMADATFTVTNLGAYGVEWFNPIVSAPQVCILGVGAVQQREGHHHLPLSLTFDHRALDGAAAARFLADLADTIAAIDVAAVLNQSEESPHAQ